MGELSNIMLQYFEDELITCLSIYEKYTEFSMKDTVPTDTLIEYF